LKNVDQAIERYERYLQADPRNTTLWIALGDVLHGAGLFDRAEQAFRSSLEIEPTNTVAWGRMAAVEISRGHFESAEAMLRQMIAQGENQSAVLYNLALTLYLQRKFEAALDLFDARYRLLSCLHNLDRTAEGIARGEAFLQQADSAKLRGYLALIYLDAFQMNEACEHARAALKMEPNNADAAAVLGTHAIETQRIDEAEHLLQLVATQEPNNVRAWQGLALAALYREQHEQALGHLQRAIVSDPKNLGNYITLGWTHLTRHDYANAERAFRQGIDIDRNEAELHGGLATALVFQNRQEEARSEIARALGLEKQCFGAHFARSIQLRLSGKEDKAVRLVEQILQTRMRADGSSLLESLVDHWKRRPPERKP
jgi:Flp pilus assembly protein TadD